MMPVGHEPLSDVMHRNEHMLAFALVLMILDSGYEMSVDVDLQLRHRAMDDLVRRLRNVGPLVLEIETHAKPLTFCSGYKGYPW